MPERAPTYKERKQWDNFLSLTDRVGKKILANSARSLMAKRLQNFAASRNIQIPTISNDTEQKLIETANEWKRLKRAVNLVETYELGLRFRNGDIDIMAPAHYTQEQIADLNLSGWFVPIAIGIIVIGTVLARMLYLDQESDRLAQKYDTMIKASEKIICADPNSSDCIAWEEEKETSDYNNNKTLIDEITESLGAVGGTIKKGLGWGAVLAIPIIAYMLLKK